MHWHTKAQAERQGHAVMDLPSRYAKAQKIADLLCVSCNGPPKRMLEVGCGSGGISHWFGKAGPIGWNVSAVDIQDARAVTEGYEFQTVSGTTLPFADATFDLVLSNHVIEHVGDQHAQRDHLQEVKRVLRPAGVAYLAVPNRWMLLEPHFRLPFLSWLPNSLAHVYVRLAGKGTHYDCLPFTVSRLEVLLGSLGFEFTQFHGSALLETYKIERPGSLLYRAVLMHIPDRVYSVVRRLFPTLIYSLRLRGSVARDVPAR